MISRFFNHASMHPVKTALYGAAIILATPFVLPYLAPAFVAPVATLAKLFGLTAIGAGTLHGGAHAVRNIGPAFNSASANAGKIALSGLGVGIAAPYIAPLLGSLGAPALALAGIFAPAAMLLGAGLLATRLAAPLFRPRGPQHA